MTTPVVKKDGERVDFFLNLSQKTQCQKSSEISGVEKEQVKFITSSKHFLNGSELFDAQYITECSCQILGWALHPELYPLMPDVRRQRLDNLRLGIRWNNLLRTLREPSLLEPGYLAVDNLIHLQSYIGSLVQMWRLNVAINYFSVSSSSPFAKIKASGPRRNDVIAMVASLGLAEADIGILIYECVNQEKDTLVFEVRHHKTIYQSIVRRCQKMQDYMLLGCIPPCRHNKNARSGEYHAQRKQYK